METKATLKRVYRPNPRTFTEDSTLNINEMLAFIQAESDFTIRLFDVTNTLQSSSHLLKRLDDHTYQVEIIPSPDSLIENKESYAISGGESVMIFNDGNHQSVFISASKIVKEFPLDITSDYTAKLGDVIYASTDSSGFIITLPENPLFNDWVKIVDKTGWFDVNNLTISGNGSNIDGKNEDLIIDVNKSIELRYSDVSNGWRLI